MILNINSDALVKHTLRLEKMRKTALPNAVRSALNSAAFDVKTTTMPAMVKQTFTQRSPNFFKANSSVEMAKGNAIDSMKSTVGFVSEKLKGSSNFAVKDLEQQEHGGTIDGRSFIPTDEARVGASESRQVRPINRLANIKNIISTKTKGRYPVSGKQKFIRAAFVARKKFGDNGFVLNFWQGQRATLSRIDEVSSSLTRKLQIKRTPVYSFRKGRHVAVKGTGFMKRASYESGMKMDDFYINAARKELAKLK